MPSTERNSYPCYYSARRVWKLYFYITALRVHWANAYEMHNTNWFKLSRGVIKPHYVLNSLHFMFNNHSAYTAWWSRYWPWWRHQNGNIFRVMAICAGNSPVPGEFPTQRPVTRSFDVFFDLRPNKRLSKQSWGWWFETPSRSLWRHSDNFHVCQYFFSWLKCQWING